MAAAAPHTEQRGSAELCSLWQRQGQMERHGAASWEGQVVHQRAVGTERAAQGSGHGPECRSSGSVWTLPSDFGFGGCCMEPGAGLDSPCRSFLTQDIL